MFLRTFERKGIGSKITQKVRDSLDNPLIFKALNGDLAHGYEGEFLIELCEAVLDNRASLHGTQQFLAVQAEIIIRAAARVGITALIDEATGYIKDKRQEEYRELFRDFIREQCREWEKEFPDQFFNLIYRLYNLRRNPNTKNHPQFFGKFIRRYVYIPIADSQGAVLQMLDEKNPVIYTNGGRKFKMHQFLSDVVGLPALRSHLWQLIGIGGTVDNKTQFDRAFKKAFPKGDYQTEFDYGD